MQRTVAGIVIALSFFFLLSTNLYATTEQTVEVKVVKGDTLINFCRSHLMDWKEWPRIARINRLRNPDRVYAGQVLVVPASMLNGLPMDGQVTFAQGEVRMLPVGSVEWLPLAPGAAILEGQRIGTGPDGTAEIAFQSGVTLILRPKTEITAASVRDQGALSYWNRFLLRAGKAMAIIKKATGRENRFRIETPSAIAAARGTEFRSGFDTDGVSRFEVLDGTVAVEAGGKTVSAGPGEGAIVEKGGAPSAPKRLLSPPRLVSPPQPYRRMPLSFVFDHDAGTVGYEALLSRDAEGREIVRHTTLLKDEPFLLAAVPDGTYYVRATDFDEEGLEGIPSAVTAVTVRVNPVPPYIEAPAEKSEQSGKRVEMRWMRVKDAATYHLQVSRTAAFTGLLLDVKDVADTSHRATLPDYGDYVMRIASVAPDGYEGEWSDPVSFSLSAAPLPPSLDQPSMDKDRINIRWQNLGPGIHYHVQLSGEEDFRTILQEKTVADSQAVLQKPEQPGNYYVRTASIDRKGFMGDFSSPQMFRIAEDRRGLAALIGGSVVLIIMLLAL